MNFNHLAQKRICWKFSAEYYPTEDNSKLGIALNVRGGLQPINGLRHIPEHGTSGWYVWAGETVSETEDFFRPLHIEHLPEWCPQILPYLGLPPGWRFLLAEGYEDVWFDKSLIQ